MPGKRISQNMNSSNLHTNKTSVFGSMAGLAPTATVRPQITGLPGYKFTRSAANGLDWKTGSFLSSVDKSNGCGLGRKADPDGNNCVKHLGFTDIPVAHYPGKRHF